MSEVPLYRGEKKCANLGYVNGSKETDDGFISKNMFVN